MRVPNKRQLPYIVQSLRDHQWSIRINVLTRVIADADNHEIKDFVNLEPQPKSRQTTPRTSRRRSTLNRQYLLATQYRPRNDAIGA